MGRPLVGDHAPDDGATMQPKVHPLELLAFGKLEQSVSCERARLIEVLFEIACRAMRPTNTAGWKAGEFVIAVESVLTLRRTYGFPPLSVTVASRVAVRLRRRRRDHECARRASVPAPTCGPHEDAPTNKATTVCLNRPYSISCRSSVAACPSFSRKRFAPGSTCLRNAGSHSLPNSNAGTATAR